MSKQPQKNRKARLADMASRPQVPPPYKPPPPDVCDEVVYPVEVTPVDRFIMRQRIYRGKVADFAIMQQTLDEDEWVDVARIDCCGGTIHRHQFVRGADEDIYDHRVIVEIPSDAGWEVVDQGYQTVCDLMFNEWDDNLRRWRDGR